MNNKRFFRDATLTTLLALCCFMSTGCDFGAKTPSSSDPAAETASKINDLEISLDNARTARAETFAQAREIEREIATASGALRRLARRFGEKERAAILEDFADGATSTENEKRPEVVRLFSAWKKLVAAEKKSAKLQEKLDALDVAIVNAEALLSDLQTRFESENNGIEDFGALDELSALVDVAGQEEAETPLSPDDLFETEAAQEAAFAKLETPSKADFETSTPEKAENLPNFPNYQEMFVDPTAAQRRFANEAQALGETAAAEGTCDAYADAARGIEKLADELLDAKQDDAQLAQIKAFLSLVLQRQESALFAELKSVASQLSESDDNWFDVLAVLEECEKLAPISELREKSDDFDREIKSLQRLLEHFNSTDPNAAEAVKSQFLKLVDPEEFARQEKEKVASATLKAEQTAGAQNRRFAFRVLTNSVVAILCVFVALVLTLATRRKPRSTYRKGAKIEELLAEREKKGTTSGSVKVAFAWLCFFFAVGTLFGGPTLGGAFAGLTGAILLLRKAIKSQNFMFFALSALLTGLFAFGALAFLVWFYR